MSARLYSLAHAGLGLELARRAGIATGLLARHRFPDGERWVRFETPPAGQRVALLCPLNQPDEHVLDLLFAADAARAQGALSVGLVAPYLAYLRQDAAFSPGEAVTSVTFARLLSQAFDWVLTVDPHLHRYARLSEIYSIPALSVGAAPLIAAWVREHLADAVLIGPDAESEQWVRAVAQDAAVPWATCRKRRLGDHQVELELPDLSAHAGRRAVLVDDIISSGRTLVEAVRALTQRGFRWPVCIAVHGVFAEESYPALLAAGAGRVVTTDTVPHPASNLIGVAGLLAEPLSRLLAGSPAARGGAA